MTTLLSNVYEPVDIVLVRGGDVTILFNVLEPLPSNDYADLTGHTVVFRAKGIEREVTSFGTYGGRPCQVAVILGPIDLRKLSADPTPYELEDRYGGLEVIFGGGDLFGAGGTNPDG